MNTSLYTKKEYLITAALNLVSFILWFLPAIDLEIISLSLGETYEALDIGIISPLYIIFAILGIIAALLPVLKEVASLDAIPQIKAGLFFNLQGAPLFHAIFAIFALVATSNETRGGVDVGFTFAGILALLVGIADLIWQFKLKKAYNVYKKEQKKATPHM